MHLLISAVDGDVDVRVLRNITEGETGLNDQFLRLET